MTDHRLVYSTDRSRAPVARREDDAPVRRDGPGAGPKVPDDGVVRVFRERGGRGGKVVTIVRGLPGGEATRADIAGELRRLCAAGGAIKEGAVELQGDHRDLVAAWLRERGHRVKLAGG